MGGGVLFSWHHYDHVGLTGLAILGVVIALAVLGIFVFVFYLPRRPRKLGLLGRMRKRARLVRFTHRREEWMDQVGQSELKTHDRRNLAKHLSSVHPELRQKAAHVLRQNGGPEGVREALRQLAERGDPDLVSDAIVSAQWSEMEPALLPLIDGQERIAVAAMSTLAEVGGGASLSALLAQKGRPDLAGTRERAIVRLQERLKGHAGQVSLAQRSEDSGALGFPKE